MLGSDILYSGRYVPEYRLSLPNRQHLNNHCSKNVKCHKYLEARLPCSNTNIRMSTVYHSLLSTCTSPTVGHVTGCSRNSQFLKGSAKPLL